MEDQPARVGKKEDLHCAECNRLTEHEVLASYKTHWSHPEDDGIAVGATHEFLRCRGCKSGTYRRVDWSTEDMDRPVTLYPPRGGTPASP